MDRMSGCARMGQLLLGVTGLGLALFCFMEFQKCSTTEHWPDGEWLATKRLLKDLCAAVQTYEVEFNRLPSPEAGPLGQDISSRSRDPFPTMLIGKEDAPKNSLAGIKFIDLPPAGDRKRGLWQDSDEWVLSDPWGETYYIVLDTNRDSKLTNPEFGADQSDRKYAAKCRNIPPPPTLPVSVIVYSSGPDRDPKTWNDNICSWHQ